jgi:hypothetical protein
VDQETAPVSSDHAGGRSELLIQPSTLFDFNGSDWSHVGHCMTAGPLPSLGSTRTILRPHLGQFEYSGAKECHSFGASDKVCRQDRACGYDRALRACLAMIAVAVASKRETGDGRY